MKILLTGAAGYVGTIVRRHLTEKHDVTGVDMVSLPDAVKFSFDLVDAEAVQQLAKNVAPDVVIHAAGNKNIGFCEEHPDDAFRVNCEAVKNVAKTFGTKARIIYLSTDYVFDGRKGGYRENDTTSPQTVYGRSKLCGEEEGRRLAGKNFVTIRLSALYDAHAAFPRFIQEKLSKRQPIDCFLDVLYSPTYYRDFLATLDRLLGEPGLTGPVYHICGETTTRYSFARTYAEVFGFNTELVRESSVANAGKFLFPNLSLNCNWSLERLKIRSTGIREALMELQKENQ